MRIGFFTDSYRPYTSGVVRSIETFATELNNLQHQVYIFAPQYKNCTKEPGVFRYMSIPSPTNQEFSLAIPISINARALIKKLEIDIIHVHSPFLLGGLGARLARSENIPLVYTYHTLYNKYVHYLPFAQEFSSKVVQKLATEFCNKCNLVVTPTNIVKNIICQNGVKTKVVNIPTGIDLKAYQDGDPHWLRRTYGISAEHRILLFVGRIGQEKNLTFLIKCFERIQRDLPDTILLLVGEGPQKLELEELIQTLGLAKKVTFTGVLDKKAVINCYLGADLFVFPSITETQGLVIGEAQAAGLPVVAVNAFGVKEMMVHERTGYLTELDQREFADRVIDLLQNTNLYQYMSAQALISASQLSSSTCTIKLLEFYQELLNTKRLVAGY